MEFQVFSDLHITVNKAIPDIKPKTDYLILAGDIGRYDDDNFHTFIKYVDSNWKKVFYILGNHEAYSDKYTFQELLDMYKKLFSNFKNIVFLYNQTYNLGDYLIVGSTLWSNPYKIPFFKRPILFNIDGKKLFNRSNYLSLRNECLRFLSKIKTNKKVILITHFPVTNKNTYDKKIIRHKQYITWLTNNLDIKRFPFYKNLSLIISGHTHHNYDFKQDNVRMISNQSGYKHQGSKLAKPDGMFKIYK